MDKEEQLRLARELQAGYQYSGTHRTGSSSRMTTRARQPSANVASYGKMQSRSNVISNAQRGPQRQPFHHATSQQCQPPHKTRNDSVLRDSKVAKPLSAPVNTSQTHGRVISYYQDNSSNNDNVAATPVTTIVAGGNSSLDSSNAPAVSNTPALIMNTTEHEDTMIEHDWAVAMAGANSHVFGNTNNASTSSRPVNHNQAAAATMATSSPQISSFIPTSSVEPDQPTANARIHHFYQDPTAEAVILTVTPAQMALEGGEAMDMDSHPSADNNTPRSTHQKTHSCTCQIPSGTSAKNLGSSRWARGGDRYLASGNNFSNVGGTGNSVRVPCPVHGNKDHWQTSDRGSISMTGKRVICFYQ